MKKLIFFIALIFLFTNILLAQELHNNQSSTEIINYSDLEEYIFKDLNDENTKVNIQIRRLSPEISIAGLFTFSAENTRKSSTFILLFLTAIILIITFILVSPKRSKTNRRRKRQNNN